MRSIEIVIRPKVPKLMRSLSHASVPTAMVRTLVNWDAIEAIAIEQGYALIYPKRLPIIGQVALFHRAIRIQSRDQTVATSLPLMDSSYGLQRHACLRPASEVGCIGRLTER